MSSKVDRLPYLFLSEWRTIISTLGAPTEHTFQHLGCHERSIFVVGYFTEKVSLSGAL